MKKIIAVLLTAALTLSVTACAQGKGVSRADYDKLVKERDKLQAQNEKLQDEMDSLKKLRTIGDSNDEGKVGNPYSSVKKGDIIQFGGFEWRVLEADYDEHKALILSDKVITQIAYHGSDVAEGGISYADSSVRMYLNGDFYDLFSEEEKAIIINTPNVTNDNPKYSIPPYRNEDGTPGSVSTEDNIFLLSSEEFDTYIGDADAWYKYDAETERESWWLRSPGTHELSAEFVFCDGKVLVHGSRVISIEGGLRPALWLNLQ